MKFMQWAKDGGDESNVTGFYLIEIKSMFSIILLRFSDGYRENYHSHAFNAFSWLLKGHLYEDKANGFENNHIRPSPLPFITSVENVHKVTSFGVSWAITFRGSWSKDWYELTPDKRTRITLNNGRKIIKTEEWVS